MGIFYLMIYKLVDLEKSVELKMARMGSTFRHMLKETIDEEPLKDCGKQMAASAPELPTEARNGID